MSWRPSEDTAFISAEQSPAMFHMDVEGIYDHVVEVHRNFLIMLRSLVKANKCNFIVYFDI